jgi:hypothetical protein
MSETAAVGPALTKEEWKAAIRDRAGMAAAVQRAWGDDEHRGDEHALAALLLVYKPYGFTWEDVEAIRRCAEFAGPDDDSERALSAAARIGALLPPRK